jgi:glutathione S-transferase
MLGGAVAAAKRLKLWILPASHPCLAVEEALRLKGLAYDRVVLLPPMQAPVMRLMFGKRTVPGLVLPGGEKVVGSRAIVRVLDGLAPDPPMLPDDAALRAKVERAEDWGDEALQPLGRRLLWAAFGRDPAAMPSFTEGSKLPLPLGVVKAVSPLAARVSGRINGASDAAAVADVAALPGHLDRIERWIDQGVIGGEQPNAADLQIASSLALLMRIGDLRDALAARPAGRYAQRLFPEYPGDVPAGTLPAAWLAPLRAEASMR